VSYYKNSSRRADRLPLFLLAFVLGGCVLLGGGAWRAPQARATIPPSSTSAAGAAAGTAVHPLAAAAADAAASAAASAAAADAAASAAASAAPVADSVPIADGVPIADAVLIAPAGFAGDVAALQDVLAEAGVHALLVFPPATAVAPVNDEAALRLRADGFAVLRAGAAPPAGASQQVLRALALVNALRAEATQPQPPLPSGAGTLGLDSDLKNAPPATVDPATVDPTAAIGPAAASADFVVSSGDAAAATGLAPPSLPGVESFATSVAQRLGFLPSATEPAAFAAGSVAVSVVFPQSSGAYETSSESWINTDPNNPGDRRACVLTKVDTALAWWAARLPGGQLTFVVPPTGTLGAPSTAATPYEPIRHATLQDGLWRWPIMRNLGFGGGQGDNPPPEVAYDNAVRQANHTDWAFTIYVVDNLHDADGWFGGADDAGMLAYTFSLFGPYMVVTYENGYQLSPTAFGPQVLDAIVAHEMGHVFGALDEYYGPLDYSGPNLYSGYLWVRNANAVRGGSTNLPCIMRAGVDSIGAYRNAQMCPSTQGQVGLRDSRGAGIPDVVDTRPRFTDEPQSLAGGGKVTLTGTVREKPWPRGRNTYGSAFDHDISIFVPHDVHYRIDGGDWTPAAATDADGLFDQPREGWTLTTAPLSDGHHVLRFAATTGTTRGFTRDIWVGDTPISLGLTTDHATITYGKSAVLTVSSTSGGYPVPRLAQVVLGRVGAAGVVGTTNGTGVWRRAFAPHTSATYRGSFAGYGQFVGPAASNTVTVKVRVLVTEHRALSPVKLGGTMAIWGTIKPLKANVRVHLDESRDDGASWRLVAHAHTDSASRFAFAYRTTHRGRVLLRVRYAGDTRNLGNAHAVARFTVY